MPEVENKKPRRTSRGCSWLCQEGETCPGPRGVPHHHHGVICLLYDVWPYTGSLQRRVTREQLGRLLSGALVPKPTLVRRDDGRFASWAPSIPQDDAMVPYADLLPTGKETTQERNARHRRAKAARALAGVVIESTERSPRIDEAWTGTAVARGCGVTDAWCDLASCDPEWPQRHQWAEWHHHHRADCLMYDVWPYSAEAQLLEVERVFGTGTVGWSRFTDLPKTKGAPIEAGLHIPADVPKVRWVPELRLDYVPAPPPPAPAPAKKKHKGDKDPRLKPDKDRLEPLVAVNHYVVPESWGPRRSAPKMTIGTPPRVRSEDAYRYGCAKLAFMNADACWAAIRRTLADNDSGTEVEGAELVPYLCREAPHGWHAGHQAPAPQRLQS